MGALEDSFSASVYLTLNRYKVTRERHTADFIAETVTLSVGYHSGNGELVSMVTLRGGLWADSPPALATV